MQKIKTREELVFSEYKNEEDYVSPKKISEEAERKIKARIDRKTVIELGRLAKFGFEL